MVSWWNKIVTMPSIRKKKKGEKGKDRETSKESQDHGGCVGMSGKKTGVKKKGADAKPKDFNKCEKEINENGIEKENVPVIINDNQIPVIINDNQIDEQHDSTSLDSKCSASYNNRSVKRRFSFGKGKKKNLETCVNGNKKGVGIRRSHSLNIFNKPDGRSRIPIFRQKNENKNTKENIKLVCSPRLQIASTCESRSLVLNPGMDCWRMAGLMDTVSKMNSQSAIDTLKPPSPTPNVALASSLSQCTVEPPTEKVRDAETLSNELDYSTMVNGNNVFDHSLLVSSDNVPAITLTLNGETEHLTEPVQTNVTSNNCVTASTNDIIPSQLHTEKESELLASTCNNTTNVGVGVSERVQLVVEDCLVESSICDVQQTPLADDVTQETRHVGFPLDLSVQGTSTGAGVSEDVLSRGGKHNNGYVSSENGCVVAITPDCSDRDVYETETGGHEYTIIQELYELDSENTISVRKLQDLVLETQIQMPKAVCCEDWLVLDFSHGDLIS